MKKVFVALFVTVPLGTAALFIVNGVASETFPFFSEPVDESQFLEQTYQSAKEHCLNNENSDIAQSQSYEECIKMVEEWFTDNPYK